MSDTSFHPLLYIFQFETELFVWCSLSATVVALPSQSTAGRLLLLLNSISEQKETSSSKRAKKKLSYDVGTLVQAEVKVIFCSPISFPFWMHLSEVHNFFQITEIKSLELRVKFGPSLHGRVHITEVLIGSIT